MVWEGLLAEPEPGLLPQISSDGSGGVAPAWHVTLPLDVSSTPQCQG